MPKLSSILLLLTTAFTHPSEARALITYSVWRDPLHSISDDPVNSGWERDSMKQCYAFLDATSRSFSAVIKELEGELGRVVTLFYLILRGLDTIEDDMTIPIEKKTILLESFYKKLSQPGWTFTESGPNEKDRALLVGFDVVIQEFLLLSPEYQASITNITLHMGAGMSRYCTLHSTSAFSVDTLASFDLYCHYVAGLVGEGLSSIFSLSSLETPFLATQLSLSNSMGLLLQKTNILRDFKEDLDDKRVFWPKEIWGKYVTGESPADLLKDENKDKALWALSEMTVDALTHATDALDYLSLLKNQSVFNFCAIPQVMAIATLERCFGNYKVFEGVVKIRKGEAVKLILAATNPRDVSYIFRDLVRKIHAKAKANDPSFIKIAVLAGQVEQWTESRYPSFIDLTSPTGIPKFSEDFQEGMDLRIRQLPSILVADPALAERRRIKEKMQKEGGYAGMSWEDIKFLLLILGGVFGVVAMIVAVAGGGVWALILREGAPLAGFFNDDLVVESVKAVVEGTKHVEL